MDADRFDALLRALVSATTRRRMSRLLGGFVIGGLAFDNARTTHDGLVAAANKKRRRRRRRKKDDKKRLPAPEAFGCTVADNSCNAGFISRPCPLRPDGLCHVTTDNQPMCTTNTAPLCVSCTGHRTCQNFLSSAGARCVVCPGCSENLNNACFRPV